MRAGTARPPHRPALRWRRHATVLLGVAVALGAIDWAVGRWQQHLIEARKEYRKKLDRLAFQGVRTGIDDIVYDPASGYRVQIRVQNATDDPLYVMMPSVTAFVQVGPGWTGVPVAEVGSAEEGSVVRLDDERTTEWVAAIDVPDYTELMPGYMHLKLDLEAYVSPEANPQEEVGERREELFLYLKDYRLADDASRHGGTPSFKDKPDFIPLRAWTLIPREKKGGKP
jgi:hypothetical protein